MKNTKLTIDDLKPVEATFTLSEHEGKTYTFRKFTLASQVWLRNRFGKENIKGIFETQSLPELSELAHYMLKDKADFPTVESFQESIVTQTDRLAIMGALLKTIGISQPILEKLSKEVDAETSADANPTNPT